VASRPQAEAAIGVAVLNRMLAAGRPKSVRPPAGYWIAAQGMGASRPPSASAPTLLSGRRDNVHSKGGFVMARNGFAVVGFITTGFVLTTVAACLTMPHTAQAFTNLLVDLGVINLS
jgi:hypothetical protein